MKFTAMIVSLTESSTDVSGKQCYVEPERIMSGLWSTGVIVYILLFWGGDILI